MNAMNQPPPASSWRSRLLWLALIWACSVAALGVAAYALRLIMGALGMST